MPRHSNFERDYTFGQAMLTLRTSIGLTQAGLADLLGVSRHAVGDWEGGLNYPKAPHLQHSLDQCVQQPVFAPEREEAEILSLWKTAHQRVLLDEAWLAAFRAIIAVSKTPCLLRSAFVVSPTTLMTANKAAADRKACASVPRL